jgi:hypothetical protein
MLEQNQPVVTQTQPVAAAAVAAFNIDDYEDISSAHYAVKHPITGEATPFVVVLAGPEHPLRKKKVLDKIRQNRKDYLNKGQVKFTDPADEDADLTDLVGRCILGWSGCVDASGQEIIYTQNAAITLVTNPKKRWLRDQLKEALDQADLFIKVCAGN